MSADLKTKILDLIEKTNDPASKGQLLVMMQMLDLLAENTDATRRIANDVIASRRSLEEHRLEFSTHKTEFRDHAVQELERLASEKGANRVWRLVLGGAQAIILALGAAFFADYAKTKDTVAALKIEVAVLKETGKAGP